MNYQADFLQSARKQFEYYKLLGDKTFSQIPDDAFFWKPNESTNSVAIIVKHMWGNMMSRWTDFLTSDGEKEWRDRDGEFESDLTNKKEVLSKWEEGWHCLFKALDSIQENDFDTVVYIRNIGHTITEAINRQLCHYAYHVGQIVFIGVMIQNDKWISLSIPKGDSQKYNQEKFSKPQHKGHFTDEFLKKKEN